MPCNRFYHSFCSEYYGAGNTQLVECPTEKSGAMLTWIWVPGAARGFSPIVSFQCRLSYGACTAPICAHIKNPNTDNCNIVWRHTNTANTDRNENAALAAAVPYPGKATWISHKGQRKTLKCYKKLQKCFINPNYRWKWFQSKKTFGGGSKINAMPALYLWLAKFKGVLVSKVSAVYNNTSNTVWPRLGPWAWWFVLYIWGKNAIFLLNNWLQLRSRTQGLFTRSANHQAQSLSLYHQLCLHFNSAIQLQTILKQAVLDAQNSLMNQYQAFSVYLHTVLSS